jgi:5-(carboxyamino)imidazole ribonucleotide synthase
VIAVRAADGEFRAWPVTRNWHVDGILSASLAPAVRGEAIQNAAFAHARAIAERLDYVGVFALELFVKNGELLGNEMAPRVHNSGHWTIEGAVTSQFENHVRAVLGMPLGDTSARFPSCMLNWIGELPDRDRMLAIPGTHWHDYGKSPRPGRKVGHATVCAPDRQTLAARLEQVGHALGREAQVAPVIDVLAK